MTDKPTDPMGTPSVTRARIGDGLSTVSAGDNGSKVNADGTNKAPIATERPLFLRALPYLLVALLGGLAAATPLVSGPLAIILTVLNGALEAVAKLIEAGSIGWWLLAVVAWCCS